MNPNKAGSDAIAIFNAAVQAVQPQYLLPQHIQCSNESLRLGDREFSRDKIRNLYLIGAGKAAAAMAREAEIILGDFISEGIIVTKYDHGLPLQNIRCLEAGHPLPDAAGVEAGIEITSLVGNAGENDMVIALISGGASSLLIDCVPGSTLAEVQQVFAALLSSGATIGEVNIVRKHLSPGIKGGQLARTAWPATLVSFILSDVPGDRLDHIASGPTVPDSSTFTEAWYILEKYELVNSLPRKLFDWLQSGVQGLIADTPKPGDAIFEKTHSYLIGTNRIALQAAKAYAEELGYHSIILSDSLTGEARVKAVELLQEIAGYKRPRPACLLMGGETTVTIKGNGIGGRNQEFALAALCAMQNNHAATILAAGTDGTDGPTPAAGAMIDAKSMEIAREKKLSPRRYLAENDSFSFFQQVGGHIITGPTHTNVMDVVVALIP